VCLFPKSCSREWSRCAKKLTPRQGNFATARRLQSAKSSHSLIRSRTAGIDSKPKLGQSSRFGVDPKPEADATSQRRCGFPKVRRCGPLTKLPYSTVFAIRIATHVIACHPVFGIIPLLAGSIFFAPSEGMMARGRGRIWSSIRRTSANFKKH
jgi:hypothetical protein